MNGSARLLAAIALASLGCGGAKTPAAVAKRAPTGRTLTDAELNAVVLEVFAARELTPTRRIPIERVPEPRFLALLLRHTQKHDATTQELSPEAGFMLGSNFLPDPARRAGLATLDEVLAEEVVGFYDHEDAKVYLPERRFTTDKELLHQKATLAHEVQHALQSQLFPPLPRAKTRDEGLALLALQEGDAMVTMGAAMGVALGAPIRRTLRRLTEVTKEVPLDKLARGGRPKAIDRALDLTRARFDFPYDEGMRFVADLYRTGGFPLVNNAFTIPPRSSAQILHPNKYLAGEVPREMLDPEAPPGTTRVSVDTLGELGMRVLLERCLDKSASRIAAEGWAGDRFGVFAAQDKQLSVGWISVWDSKQDAREMEAALARSGPCWYENALAAGSKDWSIGSGFAVRREGQGVAFIRGGTKESAEARLAALLTRVGPSAPTKPITDLRVRPARPLPEPQRGFLVGDVYRNDWLGLVGRIPPGMRAEAGGRDVDLEIHRPNDLVHGGVAYSTRVTTPEQNEKTFREVESSLTRTLGGKVLSVEAVRGGMYQTPLGLGVARTWRALGTQVELELVLVPICGGTGSIVLVELYGDGFAKVVLDTWLSTFRFQSSTLPACDFLDPQ